MKINKIRTISFICTFLVGIDIYQFAGLRISLIPLLACAVYIMWKTRLIDKWFFYALSFAALCIPSILASDNQAKSLGYIIWIIFNYFSVSYVFKYLFVRNMEKTLLGVRDSYRLQILIGAILVFAGFQGRASVFYYESSYFAIALTPYVVMTMSNIIKSNVFDGVRYVSSVDFVFLLLAIYTTKSANLILICMLSIVVLSLFGRGKLKKLLIMSIVAIIGFSILYTYSMVSDDLIAKTINKLLTSDNKLEALTDRTGNRWPRTMLTFDVATSNFFGVGIGAFEEYTLSHNFPKYSWMPWYLNPIGYPAVNVYLEMAATCGWLPLLFWLFWHFKLLKSASRYKVGIPIVVSSIVVAMIALCIESSFMRPYYWMLMGFAMGQITLYHKSENE